MPWRTRCNFMARWAASGAIGQIRDQLRTRIRRGMGRALGAVATVIDSQSVRAAETVGRDARGYGGAKKSNGRKCHLVVDSKGLPLFVMRYAGQLVTWAKKHLNLILKATSRPKDAIGFVMLPRRWVAERSLA
jgi:hypothetical protein